MCLYLSRFPPLQPKPNVTLTVTLVLTLTLLGGPSWVAQEVGPCRALGCYGAEMGPPLGMDTSRTQMVAREVATEQPPRSAALEVRWMQGGGRGGSGGGGAVLRMVA